MPTHFSVHRNFHGWVGRVSLGPELASGGWGMAGGDASTGFGCGKGRVGARGGKTVSCGWVRDAYKILNQLFIPLAFLPWLICLRCRSGLPQSYSVRRQPPVPPVRTGSLYVGLVSSGNCLSYQKPIDLGGGAMHPMLEATGRGLVPSTLSQRLQDPTDLLGLTDGLLGSDGTPPPPSLHQPVTAPPCAFTSTSASMNTNRRMRLHPAHLSFQTKSGGRGRP